MVLKYDSLEKVKEHVQYNNSPVVIYGAGMIGQIIMPYMITSSGMLDNLLFYVEIEENSNRLYILGTGI